jgi:hypothetical protein
VYIRINKILFCKEYTQIKFCKKCRVLVYTLYKPFPVIPDDPAAKGIIYTYQAG